MGQITFIRKLNSCRTWQHTMLFLTVAVAISGCNSDPEEMQNGELAEENCTPLEWTALYAEPTTFDQRAVCIEGRVISTVLNTYLYPPDTTIFWDAPVVLVLSENVMSLRDAGAMPGDIIRLSGNLSIETVCPEPVAISKSGEQENACDTPTSVATFGSLGGQVIQGGDMRMICIAVDLSALLAEPHAYNHQLICTTGTVMRQDEISTLTPTIRPAAQDETLLLSTFYSTRLGQLAVPEEGRAILASGLLEVDAECLAEPLATRDTFCEDPLILYVYEWADETR